jgi:hypothetical protein
MTKSSKGTSLGGNMCFEYNMLVSAVSELEKERLRKEGRKKEKKKRKKEKSR